MRKTSFLVCFGIFLPLAAAAQTSVPPTPYFGPASGTYTHNLQVEIYHAYYAEVIYTTNGTTPSQTNGTEYEGAIPVTTKTTIKAIAININAPAQYQNSGVANASYVVNLPSESPLPQGEWAWEDGPGGTGGGCPYTAGWIGNYGTLGDPSPNNVPGAREPAAQWTDESGNLWIFGGMTTFANFECAYVNDLWMFNASTKEWTWMSGSNSYPTYPSGTGFEAGVYGTLGQFAASNTPGSRISSAHWTDLSGHLWLFGGFGYGSAGTQGYLNDLWEFNPSTRQWAWMGGSKLANQNGSYGTLRVANAGNTPGARFAPVAWADRDGNFWLFGGAAYNAGSPGDTNDLWKFNTSTKEWAWMAGSNHVDQNGIYGAHDVPSATNIPGARDNAMAWVDAEGKFWLFGGSGYGAYGYFWLNDLWEFDPSDLDWTWATGSAYGGTVINPDGPSGQGGLYDKLGVPDPGNTPGGRINASTWTDAQGNLWMFGGRGYGSAFGEGALNDLWEFDRSKWLWAWMGGSEVVPNPGNIIYGPYREASSQTQPGPRYGAASWTDKNGNLWIFGGFSTGQDYGLLNDVFEYQLP